jgi:hypothetical protein
MRIAMTLRRGTARALLATGSIFASVTCAAQGVFISFGEGLRAVAVDASATVANSADADDIAVVEFAVGYLFANGIVFEASTNVVFSGENSLLGLDAYAFEDDRLMVGYAFPVGEDFRIVPAAGATFWELTATEGFFRPGPQTERTTSGTDFAWRLGGEYIIGETFSLYFSVSRTNFDVGDDSLLSFGAKVDF